MSLEQFAFNRDLQEIFVDQANDDDIKLKTYEVLDLANAIASHLSSSYSEDLEEKQNLALRACFFLMNQLGDRRLKRADVLPDGEREEAFQILKDDYELILRFTRSPEATDAYFFKVSKEKIFDVAVMAALTFMGGNPAVERSEDPEKFRMAGFQIMMYALDASK
jgi:hypothetical protein